MDKKTAKKNIHFKFKHEAKKKHTQIDLICKTFQAQSFYSTKNRGCVWSTYVRYRAKINCVNKKILSKSFEYFKLIKDRARWTSNVQTNTIQHPMHAIIEEILLDFQKQLTLWTHSFVFWSDSHNKYYHSFLSEEIPSQIPIEKYWIPCLTWCPFESHPGLLAGDWGVNMRENSVNLLSFDLNKLLFVVFTLFLKKIP